MIDNPPSPSTAGEGELADNAGHNANPTHNIIERSRSWSGMWAVAIGDVAIAAAASWGVYTTGDAPTTAAILTSAFTAMGTMTTAYFSIRSMSNTAQHYGGNRQ